MGTGGRVLLGIGIVLALGGCGLSGFGWMEHQVGSNASPDPVAADLKKLETDKKAPDNHLKIGPHYAYYYSHVFARREKKQGKRRVATDQIDFTYYPIVSLENGDIKELDRLQKQFGSVEKIPENIALPQPKNFTVLVKTKRFKKETDIPLDLFRREEKVQGLVTSDITSLTREEKELFKEDFPTIDFTKIIIVEEGRTPVSAGVSMGSMICGGGCCFGGAMGSLAGLAMIVMGWTGSGKKKERDD